jgi:hypothetical protein
MPDKRKIAASAPKEYRLCHADGPSYLTEGVNELLSEGWRLYGYPFMEVFPPDQRDNSDQGRGSAIYCQALIR